MAVADPPVALRLAGLVALLVIIAVDALVTSWSPEPWVYIAGIALIVWGPRVVRR